MNDNEEKIYQEVNKVFDKTALCINSIAKDLLKIEKNYGSKSLFFQSKKDQFDTVRDFYDTCLKYINYLRALNNAQSKLMVSMQLDYHQKKTGLPYTKIASMLGWDVDKWHKVDKLDDFINKMKEKIGINEVTEFNDFINSIKDEQKE
jgi:hypothetical protein